jgi:hypothetical protein
VRISISAGVVLLAGLFSPLSTGKVDQHPQGYLERLKCTFNFEDSRPAKLRKLFRLHNAPAESLADDFVQAADRYSIDYRLLPAIAIVESGGGRYCINNNMFGWGNGRLRFKSYSQSIDTIAKTLATWYPYQNKSLDQALKVYNYEIPTYGKTVKRLMTMVDGQPLPPMMQLPQAQMAR